jgi:putative ABC transport system permease protein
VFSITILISSLLALLLAWSTFTVLANERRREVGILRAIGAHQSHIMKIFLAEAMLISTMGGLAGVIMGHSLIHYLAKGFTLLSKLGAVSAVTMGNITIGLIAMGVGIAICLIGAAIPIFRLARMEPLLAIKEA